MRPLYLGVHVTSPYRANGKPPLEVVVADFVMTYGSGVGIEFLSKNYNEYLAKSDDIENL